MLPRYLIYCFDGWVGPQTETVATGHIYDKKLYLGPGYVPTYICDAN